VAEAVTYAVLGKEFMDVGLSDDRTAVGGSRGRHDDAVDVSAGAKASRPAAQADKGLTRRCACAREEVWNATSVTVAMAGKGWDTHELGWLGERRGCDRVVVERRRCCCEEEERNQAESSQWEWSRVRLWIGGCGQEFIYEG
jgi:hypothetical protein